MRETALEGHMCKKHLVEFNQLIGRTVNARPPPGT